MQLGGYKMFKLKERFIENYFISYKQFARGILRTEGDLGSMKFLSLIVL